MWYYKDKELENCVVYWIHNVNHCDITTDGYVGVSRKFKHRVNQHIVRGTNYYVKKQFEEHFDETVFSIIYNGDESTCYQLEYELRPTKNIGWNFAVGGSRVAFYTQGKRTSSLKGRKQTPEHIENVKKSKIGIKFSDKARENMSKSKLGKPAKNRKRVYHKGVEYSSATELARTLNVTISRVSYWAKNNIRDTYYV